MKIIRKHQQTKAYDSPAYLEKPETSLGANGGKVLRAGSRQELKASSSHLGFAEDPHKHGGPHKGLLQRLEG